MTELGAIGIITLSAIFALMAGKTVSRTQSALIHDSFTASNEIDIRKLVKLSVLFLAGFELLGATLFFIYWAPEMGIKEALFQSIFHSISAFCNAGISSFRNNLAGFESNMYLNATFIFLFLSGGAGFLTIAELYEWCKRKLGRETSCNSENMQWRWSLQTRIVLMVTSISILFGGALMFVLEYHGSHFNKPIIELIVSSIFHVASSRSAGFATIDISEFSNATIYLFMILMFVGGAPVSTAGGIKVTTFAILIGMAISRMRGSKNTMFFHRTVSEQVVSKAISIVFIAIAVLTTLFFLLLITETWFHPQLSVQRDQFLPLLFEAISAFGTVGLSLGATPDLSEPGKIIVALLMLAGRLGPLTVALLMVTSKRAIVYSFA